MVEPRARSAEVRWTVGQAISGNSLGPALPERGSAGRQSARGANQHVRQCSPEVSIRYLASGPPYATPALLEPQLPSPKSPTVANGLRPPSPPIPRCLSRTSVERSTAMALGVTPSFPSPSLPTGCGSNRAPSPVVYTPSIRISITHPYSAVSAARCTHASAASPRQPGTPFLEHANRRPNFSTGSAQSGCPSHPCRSLPVPLRAPVFKLLSWLLCCSNIAPG